MILTSASFCVHQVLTAALARELESFFAARFLALQDLDDRRFVGFAADVLFHFEARDFGEHSAQHHRAQLVAGLHRGAEFFL